MKKDDIELSSDDMNRIWALAVAIRGEYEGDICKALTVAGGEYLEVRERAAGRGRPIYVPRLDRQCRLAVSPAGRWSITTVDPADPKSGAGT